MPWPLCANGHDYLFDCGQDDGSICETNPPPSSNVSILIANYDKSILKDYEKKNIRLKLSDVFKTTGRDKMLILYITIYLGDETRIG